MASAAPTGREDLFRMIFDVRSGEKFSVFNGTERIPYIYPHEAFAEANGKPHLIVPVHRPVSKNTLVITKEEIAAVASDFNHRTDLKMICSFLYKMMYQFTGVETNVDGWHSYKVEIAKPKTVVSINQLLDIHEVPFWTGGDNTTYTAATEGHHLQTLVAKCLIPYRMNYTNISKFAYISDVIIRLRDLYSAPPYEAIPMKGLPLASTWTTDKMYCKIAAAYDQFFVHFDTHEYVSLRECTRDANMKGCGLLGSIETAAKCLGITNAKFFTYIFVERVADGVRQVLKNAEKEEMDIKDSYFRYAMEYGMMGMMPRSPYSASAAPELFVFTHMIGSLHSVVRSVNSRMLQVVGVDSLFKNAIYVSFYLGEGTLVGLQSMLSKDEAERHHNDKEPEEEKELESHATDPEQILQRMNEGGLSVPDFMKKRFLSTARAVIRSKPGTVGEFVAIALGMKSHPIKSKPSFNRWASSSRR